MLGAGAVFAGCLWMALWLSEITASRVLGVALASVAGLVLLSVGINRMLAPSRLRIRALVDSAESLRDADFSATIANDRTDDVGRLVDAYNQMVATLRDERQNLHQRELMLDTVLQASPLALVLCNDNDHVIYANSAARTLFEQGKRFAGRKFIADVALSQPESLRKALADGVDAMVTVESSADAERYHLSCSEFTLNARRHRLYLLKQLTHELNRQEVATWKKVIRLIGHELNNSLAPISSLAHSAQLMLERDQQEKVPAVLNTIETRSAHLKGFIEGYSRFAKLPLPNITVHCWDDFLARLSGLHPFNYEPIGPAARARFDEQQLEQVVINLYKNAIESESAPEDIELEVVRAGLGWQLTLRDRGRGMSDEALASALLPFYSTKKSGSGLGLSLCREIIDAHQGRISLRNRKGGGLAVAIWLPDNAAATAAA